MRPIDSKGQDVLDWVILEVMSSILVVRDREDGIDYSVCDRDGVETVSIWLKRGRREGEISLIIIVIILIIIE